MYTSARSTDSLPRQRQLLKNARLEKGWTQQELADRVTEKLAGEIVNVQSVGRWERGEAFPDPEILPALCTVLGKKSAEVGLQWELYHPANRDEKPNPTQATTDAKQEEQQPVPPPVTPTQRNPLRKNRGLLVTGVICVVLLGIVGGMIVSALWHPSLTPFGVPTAVSGTTIAPCAAAPILTDPVDGQMLNSLTVTLTWEAPRGCLPEGYTVRITANYDPEAKPWIVDTGWAPTYYKYTFPADGTYYWHIRACKPCTPFHPGNWAIRIFTIHTSSIP